VKIKTDKNKLFLYDFDCVIMDLKSEIKSEIKSKEGKKKILMVMKELSVSQNLFFARQF
jgi:hypothetical protein